MIEILDPTHGEAAAEFLAAPRLASLEGMTVGIVSNGKMGTEPFFAALATELRSLGAAEVERVIKSNYSAPAEPEVMDRTARWNAMVSGIGD